MKDFSTVFRIDFVELVLTVERQRSMRTRPSCEVSYSFVYTVNSCIGAA